MSRYRRAQVPGATYFFTVNLRNRRSDLLVRHVSLNSVFLDPPKSENVAPEMVAALQRLQVIEKKSGLERRPNSLRSRD